jgi:hypothetical protein
MSDGGYLVPNNFGKPEKCRLIGGPGHNKSIEVNFGTQTITFPGHFKDIINIYKIGRYKNGKLYAKYLKLKKE